MGESIEITLRKLLHFLTRPDVSEVAMATGRFPAVRMPEGFRAISNVALTSEEIFEALKLAGGAKWVHSLSEKPAQWAFRVSGLGTATVVATARGSDLHARITLTSREPPKPGDGADSSRDPDAPPMTERAPHATQTDPQRPPPVVKSPAMRDASSLLSPQGPLTTGHASPGIDFAGAGEIRKPPAHAVDRFDPSATSIPADDGSLEGLIETTSFREAKPAVSRSMPAVRASIHPEQAVRISTTDAPPASRPAVRPRAASLANMPAWSPNDPLWKWLERGRQKRASDVHIIAGRPVLFRIAGLLLAQGDPLSAEEVEGLLVDKIPERLRDGFAADGSCDFSLASEGGRARANIVRQRTGMKGCFRLISSQVPTLKDLDLPTEVENAIHHHQGLIVVTGPTGHGKTSTLAAIVDVINRTQSHHVITVEDPIEYVHSQQKAILSQREVGSHTKTFAAALKGSLREDPDVIVVGELRDTETMRLAITASETGHLVIGTMNTPTAAKTIDRIIDLFPPGDQAQVRTTLAGGLKLIVGQRLLPSLDGTRMHVAVETLTGSVALWNLIREEKTYQIPSLQQRGKGLGILRLDDALVELVKAQKVSLAEAQSVAESPEGVASAVRAGEPPPPPPVDKPPEKPAEKPRGFNLPNPFTKKGI